MPKCLTSCTQESENLGIAKWIQSPTAPTATEHLEDNHLDSETYWICRYLGNEQLLSTIRYSEHIFASSPPTATQKYAFDPMHASDPSNRHGPTTFAGASDFTITGG
ncbi:hypothetical protein WG66_008356 [Moniliophthora roreri]|nr:hypothetical protein WG66_008356 [Moniliophthora roreri]